MRIIGQNILCCRVKTCLGKNKGLKLFVEESKVEEREFNREMVLKMFEWMDWSLLLNVATQLGETEFPTEANESLKSDEEFLKKLHTMLFEFEVLKGKLVCEDCERSYPIIEGIPNLIMDEEEI